MDTTAHIEDETVHVEVSTCHIVPTAAYIVPIRICMEVTASRVEAATAHTEDTIAQIEHLHYTHGL